MNRFLCLLLVVLVTPGSILGCWTPYYPADDFYIGHIPVSGNNDLDMVDIWASGLLKGVPKDEIRKVITDQAGYSIDDLRSLAVGSPQLKSRLEANGGDLLDYILLMRDVHRQRLEVNSPWFYHYPGNPRTARLDSLAVCAIERRNTRLGDRYMVQAARALLTLQRYAELDSLYKIHRFKDNDMERMFRPYVGGMMYRTGHYEEALDLYRNTDDYESIMMCLKKLGRESDGVAVLEEICKVESGRNYDQLSKLLNEKINKGQYRDRLLDVSDRQSAIRNLYQPLWQYVNAALNIYSNEDYVKADSILASIDPGKARPDLRRSIEALQLVTRASVRPYNAAYIEWFASEADKMFRWSQPEHDIKFAEQCDDDSYYNYARKYYPCNYYVRDDESLIMYRIYHQDGLYFSDVAHYAADTFVVPRLFEHGDSVGALQLLDAIDWANIALPQIKDVDSHRTTAINVALELGADHVIEAITGRTGNWAIRNLWLKHGSIRNRDRWLDLAGTLLLAEGRYAEAEKMLAQVSEEYGRLRSAPQYDVDRNPFAIDPEREIHTFMLEGHRHTYYKLWFAREMNRRQKAIARLEALGSESTELAYLRLSYALGMRNSYYPCWSLTCYEPKHTPYTNFNGVAFAKEDIRSSELASFHYNYGFDWHPSRNDYAPSALRRKALGRNGERLVREAIAKFDDETAASLCKEFGYYCTIKHRYPQSKEAWDMERHCDHWSDW